MADLGRLRACGEGAPRATMSRHFESTSGPPVPPKKLLSSPSLAPLFDERGGRGVCRGTARDGPWTMKSADIVTERSGHESE